MFEQKIKAYYFPISNKAQPDAVVYDNILFWVMQIFNALDFKYMGIRNWEKTHKMGFGTTRHLPRRTHRL